MSNNFQSDKAFGKCCYVESGERCGCQRFIALENNEKTCEVNFVEIFRIQKQVGYSEIFSKTSRDHGEKNNPAKHQHLVAFQIVQ